MKQIDAATFQTEVQQSTLPVIADFYTQECLPCRMMSALLGEVEKERSDTLKVVKIDAAAEPELSASFRVTSVPTLLLFRGGQRLAQLTSAKSKKDLQRWIDDTLLMGTQQ